VDVDVDAEALGLALALADAEPEADADALDPDASELTEAALARSWFVRVRASRSAASTTTAVPSSRAGRWPVKIVARRSRFRMLRTLGNDL
jgi:hypothetical protein